MKVFLIILCMLGIASCVYSLKVNCHSGWHAAYYGGLAAVNSYCIIYLLGLA